MAFQIVWEKVNLGEDDKGELIIGHRGATLPDTFLDDYKRDALSLIGAIKLVPDEVLPRVVVDAKETSDAVSAANDEAGDEVAQTERDIAELEMRLKAARERQKVYRTLTTDGDKNVDDPTDTPPKASAGPGQGPDTKSPTSKPSETAAKAATTPAKSTTTNRPAGPKA